MKLLKIENSEGYYLKENEEYSKIDQIAKEDILILMKILYKSDDIKFDKQEESGNQKINMPSQAIVYDKLYEKFIDIYEKKEDIIEQVNLEFDKAFKAYQ